MFHELLSDNLEPKLLPGHLHRAGGEEVVCHLFSAPAYYVFGATGFWIPPAKPLFADLWTRCCTTGGVRSSSLYIPALVTRSPLPPPRARVFAFRCVRVLADVGVEVKRFRLLRS